MHQNINISHYSQLQNNGNWEEKLKSQMSALPVMRILANELKIKSNQITMPLI